MIPKEKLGKIIQTSSSEANEIKIAEKFLELLKE